MHEAQPAKKASRIIVTRPGDFLDEQLAQEPVTWLAQTADKFAGVFPKYF